jgi:hypothetical protein
VVYAPYYVYLSNTGGYGYSWYYCQSNQAYYPDVRDCPEDWTMVPAIDPAASQTGPEEPPPDDATSEPSAPPPAPNWDSMPPPPGAAKVAAPKEQAPSASSAPAKAAPPEPQLPIYSWTDDDGVTHYTNQTESIPRGVRTSKQAPRDQD